MFGRRQDGSPIKDEKPGQPASDKTQAGAAETAPKRSETSPAPAKKDPLADQGDADEAPPPKKERVAQTDGVGKALRSRFGGYARRELVIVVAPSFHRQMRTRLPRGRCSRESS